MSNRKWLGLVALVGLSACLQTTREPDCLLDQTCECKTTADCQHLLGALCFNGRCTVLPDAGTPGELGWPCTADAECLFGPCLPKGPGNGGLCSAPCGLDGGFGCDKGFACKQAPSLDGFLCAPPIRVQCLPCQVDGDCNAIGDRCTAIGDAGTFCTTDCSLTGQCPSGHVCRSVGTAGARQCIPQSNTCACSAISVGLTRACTRVNARATCFGDETCEPEGSWSGCDALLASEEKCDGLDNDCDGLTDQADPELSTVGVPGYPDCTKGTSCRGKWSCGGSPDAGFAFSCSAPDPKAESCNQADDDCNGQIDDGLVDSSGAYVSVHACGSCATDCHVVLLNLAADAGTVLEGSAACEVQNGQRVCVPKACARGFFLSPPLDPQTCAPADPNQCRPCTSVADCQVPGDACLKIGDDPDPSCVQSCSERSVRAGCSGKVGEQDCCPTGSLCTAVGSQRLCMPSTNSCQCTPDRVGLSRSCFVTSGSSTCVGSQTCNGQGAYGACDTSMTTLELCDGRDNDCDAATDEGFIDTRGTGTYDTDQHCGSCTNDCRARWSPTVQHANGGCSLTGAAPRCVIASCTTERVSGGDLCRLDSECPSGLTCHPTYRQCVKPCPCGANETCVNGTCARSCMTDGECSAFGPGARCTQGSCGLQYQFVDADLEETNGCECAAASTVDAPERYSSFPTGGLPYVDRNCDGVDGTAASSLFVWAQSSSSQGTRAAPFRTIGEAIAAFRPGTHSAILVAQGTYAEQVVLTNGVQLYGGYSGDFARRDIALLPTFIEAAEPATGQPKGTVNAENLTNATVIAGFTIRGYDVNARPAPGVPAANSFAIYARNAPGLVIQNNHIVGGRGGDATAAVAGAAGTNGGAGSDGLMARECSSPNCTNETQPGGAAGQNVACAASTSGNPGAGTNLALDPQQYSAGGINGAGGSNGVYNHSDPSQAAFCKYDCTVPGRGLVGGAAQNGTDGVSNRGGLGCTVPRGLLQSGDWSTPVATAGGSGSDGRGGGGGGGGGCVRNANPMTCTVGRRVGDLGGTGGGGGAGGCGGARGEAGAGGGASFGIFVVGAAPQIDGNFLDFGFGGVGGAGGAGGYGGLGGQGGRGGLNTSVAWCAGQGGPGGRGGNGGAGSGGGGGCGGSVFGIAGEGIAPQQYGTRNTLAPLAPLAVGAGGAGGPSPGGTGFRGADGLAGVISAVEAF